MTSEVLVRHPHTDYETIPLGMSGRGGRSLSSGYSGSSVDPPEPGTSLGSPTSTPSSTSSADQDGVDTEAFILASYYIKARLMKENMEWRDCPQLPSKPSRACIIMRTLCDDFESLHRDELNGLVQQLELSPATAFSRFQEISTALFPSNDTPQSNQMDIRWGRVVALYTFSGLLALRCVRENMPQLIGCVADWTGSFVEIYLGQWINSRGGWEDFISYHEKGPTQRRYPETWLDYRKVMAGVGAVFGVVGALTLGTMVRR